MEQFKPGQKKIHGLRSKKGYSLIEKVAAQILVTTYLTQG